jgi:MurNAc alpha-1-phosphate uridylyltransferase
MGKHVDTAMIMAAGKGTRMMPLTADRPKPLIEVGGIALLDHVLDHLRDAGIGKIVVNVHYLAEQVEKHFELTPRGIIASLGLRKPIYKATATHGHFGRKHPDFTWERTDRVDDLKSALGL